MAIYSAPLYMYMYVQHTKKCRTISVEPDALTALSLLCDGDARSALNGLELAVRAKRTLTTGSLPERETQTKKHSYSQNCDQATPLGQLLMTATTDFPAISLDNRGSTAQGQQGRQGQQGHLQEVQSTKSSQSSSLWVVTVEDVKESLQRTHLLYDRAGEEHYNIISALHKSMRGSDANASLYWLARMLCAGEDPLYVARRVVRFASEDIGMLCLFSVPVYSETSEIGTHASLQRTLLKVF